MPRYYMHSCNGNGFKEDEAGIELPDKEAAIQKAIEAARDIMSQDVRSGLLDLTSFIEVENDDHELIFTLTFLEAVTLASQYKDHRPKR